MQTIKIDLATRSVRPVVLAQQGDVGRKVKLEITDAGQAYQIPAGATFSAWYSGASGSGNYTHIGEESAFVISGNTVEVELITQMLTNAGNGEMCLVMHTADGTQLGLWNLKYWAEILPGAGSEEAQQYYTAFQEMVNAVAASADRAEQAAATFSTDSTLSVSGKAADAKAVGDKFTKQAAEVTKHVGDTKNPHNVTPEQIGATPGAEDNTYPSCYKRTVDGVVEWMNPPMVAGLEYRTTERHMGKPVYTKLIDCGTLTHGKTVTINAAFTVIRYAARSKAYIPYPYSSPDSNYYRNVQIEYNKLTLICGTSAAGTEEVYCQIWYTK